MRDSRFRLRESWRLWLAVLAIAGLSVPLAGWIHSSERTNSQTTAPGGGAEVHGYVVANLGTQSSDLRYLPGITAYVKNLGNGVESPRVTTDRKGFFVVPQQPAGSYVACIEAPGYAPVCPETFTIASDIVYLPPLKIAPKGGFVLGTVRLQDGSPCGYQDAAFGVDFDTRVTVTDSSGAVVSQAQANVAGEYLAAGLTTGWFLVQAGCEKAQEVQTLTLSGGPGTADFVLANRPPQGLIVTAEEGGKAVRQATPGAALKVAAEGEDSEELSFRWQVSDGTLSSSTGPAVEWTLPELPGVYTIYALAQDGLGGVALSQRSISTSTGVLFSGTVASGGAPVGNAAVEVNGAAVYTSQEGAFAIQVPEESSRYVLTIRRAGFQILSKMFNAPVTDRAYNLVPARSFVFDAGLGGRMAEGQDCRPRPTGEPAESPLGSSPCGAEVIIPPSSLVSANGSAVAGPVTGYVSSIDLRSPDSTFPGEYGGINSRGDEVGLNSLGAVDVQLYDSAGERVNLSSGSTATVRIPVDPLQLGMPEMPSSPPPTVPIWFYDPSSGVWNEEGEAQLAGGFYEAQVRHFSTINADVQFANPACVRVITQAPISLPYQLRVSIPAVAPTKIVTGTISDALSLIILLPASTNIKLEVLDSQNHVIQLATKVHTTGASSSPAVPPYPYTSCTSQVTMTFGVPNNGGFLNFYTNNETDADIYYSKIDPVTTAAAGTVQSAGTTVTGTGTNFTTFFQAGHLIKAAGQVRLIQTVTNNTALTTFSAFSPALPPGTIFQRVGAKPTLATWKTANGFGADDQDAVYLNAADLGLGRWMHKKKLVNGDIAYYVSNYGVPPAFGSVDMAAGAKLANNPSLNLIATVAMEFTAKPGDPVTSRYTKFYVYNNLGNRVNKADLDGIGAKYVPMLCAICHSGSTAGPSGDAKGDLQARFIAFDPESFGYSGLGPAFTQAAQETSFKEMNRGLRDFTNVTPAITELINGWYGGAGLPLAAQTATFVPTNWAAGGKAGLYSDVVKPSCRACHTTRIGRISWDKWDLLGPNNDFKESSVPIKNFVCVAKIMPHAKVTFKNFWLSTSPHRAAALANAGLPGWAPNDVCPTP